MVSETDGRFAVKKEANHVVIVLAAGVEQSGPTIAIPGVYVRALTAARSPPFIIVWMRSSGESAASVVPGRRSTAWHIRNQVANAETHRHRSLVKHIAGSIAVVVLPLSEG